MTRISKGFFGGLLLSVVFGATAQASIHTASSCSRDDVQAAVNAASDGDTILIPDGSCAWSSGISTNKQIIIRAQNYTPTPAGMAGAGTSSRNVTITNNSATMPLLSFTSGNTAHVGVGGIRFNEGSGLANDVHFEGTGSKVPLIFDCYFEVKNRCCTADDHIIAFWAQGGIMWNTVIQGVGGGAGGQCCPELHSIVLRSPRAWYTASTLGALDTTGTVNVYIEDSTWKDFGQSPDIDDNGRIVIRYSIMDGTSGLTHGFSSAWGGRHFEYYNNLFTTTSNNRNIAGRYFWARAGHGVFFNNQVYIQNQGYGVPDLLQMIVEGGGTYPKPRQVGWGHDGVTNVSDPVYIWNNTGPGAYAVGWSDSFSQSMIQLNRDVFVNSGPKPGYMPYAYPHPLRQGIGTVPAAPTSLQVK